MKKKRSKISSSPPVVSPGQKLNKWFRQALEFYKAGNIAEAEEYYRRIHDHAPNHPEALRFIALCRQRQGYFHEAARWMDKAITLMPEQPVFHFEMAMIFRQLRDEENTLRSLQNTLKFKPDHIGAYYQLGVFYYEKGNLEQAEQAYQQALAIQPNSPMTLNGLATVFQARGQRREAVQLYYRALEIAPDYVEVWNNLGNVLKDMNELDKATKAFNQALKHNPRYAEAHANFADVLIKQFRFDEAISTCDQALKLSPDCISALINRAVALGNLKYFDESLKISQGILQRKNISSEHRALAYYNIGIIYFSQGREGRKSVEAFSKTFQLDSSRVEVLGYLVYILQHLCEWTAWSYWLDKIINNIIQNKAGRIMPFFLLSTPINAELQRQCARQWAERYFSPFESAARKISIRTSDRNRLRLAYLSSDFREHPVAYVTAGLFEMLDRNDFELIAYSHGRNDESPIRKRLEKAFDRFEDISSFSFEQTAELIHNDKIDILIDLNGYTSDSRCAVLGARLAPVQVQQFGYAGTLGKSNIIDYIVGDPFVIPKEHFDHYDEKIVWLPDMYLPRDNNQEIAPIPTRDQGGLPVEGFVFCSFNQAYKILPDVFNIWMELLKEIPDGLLWLTVKSSDAKENLRRAAAAQGIKPERLVFAPTVPTVAEHLARYALADLYIDTFPYNGHTTMGDALWAGVPGVTCSGETFASRVGGSLLKAAGLEELITFNLADYKNLILQLARDRARLAQIRGRLAETRNTLALFDTAKYSDHLGRAYKTMWKRLQQGLKPDFIEIKGTTGK